MIDDRSGPSMAEKLALLPAEEREAALAGLDPASVESDWSIWGRPNQFIPTHVPWSVWLVLGARGTGKTRIGAEAINQKVREATTPLRLRLVGRTAADVRDTMIMGESGIMACSRKGEEPEWKPSVRRLTWPNGCMALTYTAEEPEALRGPQSHFDWYDELGAWGFGAQATWDNAMMGLRLGERPQAIVTTTPRPVPLIKALVAQAMSPRKGGVFLTRMRMTDNAANLPITFLEEMYARYGGTYLGRQELEGELLEDREGALWNVEMIDNHRRNGPVGSHPLDPEEPYLARIVVGVDPSVGTGEHAACGIVIAAAESTQRRAHVLGDRTIRGTPETWAKQVVAAYKEYGADTVVAEQNQGYQMVRSVIRAVDASVSVKLVRAAQGKRTRAEPISALYEQGRVHHRDLFADLESEMRSWAPNEGMPSPDRLDALVWAIAEIMPALVGAPASLHIPTLRAIEDGSARPRRIGLPALTSRRGFGLSVGRR